MSAGVPKGKNATHQSRWLNYLRDSWTARYGTSGDKFNFPQRAATGGVRRVCKASETVAGSLMGDVLDHNPPHILRLRTLLRCQRMGAAMLGSRPMMMPIRQAHDFLRKIPGRPREKHVIARKTAGSRRHWGRTRFSAPDPHLTRVPPPLQPSQHHGTAGNFECQNRISDCCRQPYRKVIQHPVRLNSVCSLRLRAETYPLEFSTTRSPQPRSNP